MCLCICTDGIKDLYYIFVCIKHLNSNFESEICIITVGYHMHFCTQSVTKTKSNGRGEGDGEMDTSMIQRESILVSPKIHTLEIVQCRTRTCSNTLLDFIQFSTIFSLYTHWRHAHHVLAVRISAIRNKGNQFFSESHRILIANVKIISYKVNAISSRSR